MKVEVPQFAEFSSAVTRELPRDIEKESAQALIRRPGVLRRWLREALEITWNGRWFGTPENYRARTLEQMIRDGGYDDREEGRDEDITSKHFPISSSGRIPRRVGWFRPKHRNIWREDVEVCMEALQVKPANIEHLLILGEMLMKYPEPDQPERLIALGSVWEEAPDLRYVPYLKKDVNLPRLRRAPYDGDWFEEDWFVIIGDE